jgi:Family of unknown function (DUF6788)
MQKTSRKARVRKTSSQEQRIVRRLEQIRKEIAAIDYICSGTVSYQTKRCGKSQCVCARDPAARHGPYCGWHRQEDGRQVHSMIPEALAPRFQQANKNYRKLRQLLKEWEKTSAKILKASQSDET